MEKKIKFGAQGNQIEVHYRETMGIEVKVLNMSQFGEAQSIVILEKDYQKFTSFLEDLRNLVQPTN